MGDTNGAELQSQTGKIKFVLGATIPTAQYSNLQPTIEVYADTFDEAYELAMNQMSKVWNANVEKGKELCRPNGDRTKIEAFCGGSIYYDAVAHVYTNEAGDVYLSGSQYAKQFETPFDAQMIAGKMAKEGATAKDIQAMWTLKGDVSKGFGTAIHAALELYGRYNGLATALEKTTHLHDHPILKQAVEGFFAGRDNEKAEYEIFVVDNARKRAGQIDRLLVTGDKRGRVQDFKTNAVLDAPKLKVYWEQLKFYAGILEADGWTIDGMDIFHFDGHWKTFNKERAKETN